MKIFKKILIFIAISVITIILLIGSVPKNLFVNPNNTPKAPIKVAVFLFRADDYFRSELRKNLENIQKENEGKVEFSYFDGKGNQLIQNECIDKALKKDFDLFMIDLVDTKIDAIRDIFSKIEAINIPVILDRPPTQDIFDFVRNYNRAIFIEADSKQSGELQGKIIVDEWNANKKAIDKNNDNVLQYIMLKGNINAPTTINRIKYSILTINNAGIKTEELASQFCNWEKECAKTSIESLILRYGNRIEAIISNNDAMAIGAIEALQKYGYSKGNKENNIVVVGIDAIPEARDLVNKGVMTGTIIQDARAQAEAIYTVGMNLVNGKYPLDSTNYKFDDTGITIRIPYKEYIKQ